MGVGSQLYAPAAFTAGKDPVPIVQDAGWAPGPVWIGAENLVPTGIRFPDRPARRQSLCRLRYLAHGILVLFIYITKLTSKEIFSPSNKIHREVGRAKDLSAPR
jgi:hypothetical protein